MENNLNRIRGIGERKSGKLREAGFLSIDDIAESAHRELSSIDGIGETSAKSYIRQAKLISNSHSPISTENVDSADIALTKIPGIGEKRSKQLTEIGIGSAEELAVIAPKDLALLHGISQNQAKKYISKANTKTNATTKNTKEEYQTKTANTTTTAPDTKSTDVVGTENQQWVFKTNGAIWSSPAVVDGTVFVGSRDSNLYAVDAESGTERWGFETDERVCSSPTVVDGTVFIGTDDGNLYAVDAETSQKEWVFKTDGWIRSSAVVVDDTVLISSDEQLYAVDTEEGDQRWMFETRNREMLHCSPTVINDTVLLGGSDGHLYVINLETGAEQGVLETGYAISSSPMMMNSTVFISGDTHLYALDIKTGEQLWEFKTGDSIESSPTVIDGNVFISSNDGKLYAVNAETGAEKWTFKTNNRIRASPTIVDGTIFFGNDKGDLYAVDAETGDQKWAFETRAAIFSSPTVVDGTVFVGNDDNNLYAVKSGVTGSSKDPYRTLGLPEEQTDYTESSITNIFSAEFDSSTGKSNLTTEDTPLLTSTKNTLVSALLNTKIIYNPFYWFSHRSTDDSQSTTKTASSLEPQVAVESSSKDTSQTLIRIKKSATEAIDNAETAEASNDLETAQEYYEKAVEMLDKANHIAQTTNKTNNQEFETEYEATQTKLENIKQRRGQRKNIYEKIQAAEQSFQEGIISYANGTKTVSRIRFRQARDTFDEVHKIVEKSHTSILDPALTIKINPQQTLSSSVLDDFTQLSDDTLNTLSAAEIESIEDLASEDRSIKNDTITNLPKRDNISHKEATLLRILSWRNTSETHSFETITDIKHRREQAEYGFGES